MQKILFFTLVTLLAAFGTASAQIKTPAPSPTGKISQVVGLTKVDVEYSRPSAKNRKIFGDLVPFGELWRTGANASTKITFGDDVKVAGSDLKAGTYALYTIPGEKEWTIIFYKNITLWGAPEPKDFKEEDVALRVVVPVIALKDPVETLTIDINNLRNNSADLEIRWENTRVVAPLVFDVDTKVMADINAQLDGPSADTYYSAARYYFEEKKDMKKALEWVNTSLSKGGDKFWILRLKANILAELGMYKDAIAVAERSTALAKTEGNADYPRMNDKSIAEWKKKM